MVICNSNIFVCFQISIADFVVFQFIAMIPLAKKMFLWESDPEIPDVLSKHCFKVLAEPIIQTYVDQRAPTPY